jgi:hypothetical protein
VLLENACTPIAPLHGLLRYAIHRADPREVSSSSLPPARENVRLDDMQVDMQVDMQADMQVNGAVL